MTLKTKLVLEKLIKFNIDSNKACFCKFAFRLNTTKR